MPELMNSSVGSLAGMMEAASIRACCLSVKNRRKVSRISSLPSRRFMRQGCQRPGRAATDFPTHDLGT
jgi:hypothetical protein